VKSPIHVAVAGHGFVDERVEAGVVLLQGVLECGQSSAALISSTDIDPQFRLHRVSWVLFSPGSLA